jgi:uncharacterized protein (DUF433 family)
MKDKKQEIYNEGGVFLTKDIALILDLSPSKVRRWRSGFWGGNTFGDKQSTAINFYTLIEFYTFYKLREKKLSAISIKKAHKIISKELATKYPFAFTTISTDGKQLWYEQLGRLIDADGTRQINLKEILEPFLEKIEFDKSSGIAKRFFPNGKSSKIVIDPNHQFGQPIIKDTNIKAGVIYSLHLGGETESTISYLYDINKKDIDDIVSFYSKAA